MKRNIILISGALVCATGLLFNSCQSAPSTKVELTNEIDSISYSFGASIGENISRTLDQLGVTVDTSRIAMEYASKIAREDDQSKKQELEKELKHKIDSITKVNDYNTLNFIKGFKDGVNATESSNSYNVGLSFGNQVTQQMLPAMKAQFVKEGSQDEINKKAILAALWSSLQKQPLMFPHASSYIMMKDQDRQREQMEENNRKVEERKAEGAKFLEKNKEQEGVVALDNGLQYKVIKEGNGNKPQITDQVVCHYEGQLLDGTVFDSSYERGEPATFPLQGVIKGWTEILQQMPAGSTWEVYIPSDLAYGDNGNPSIPGGSTLKFKIELLSIQ